MGTKEEMGGNFLCQHFSRSPSKTQSPLRSCHVSGLGPHECCLLDFLFTAPQPAVLAPLLSIVVSQNQCEAGPCYAKLDVDE